MPVTHDKGTLSAALVLEATKAARERGIEVETLLVEAGILVDPMASPRARVSAAAFSRLWIGLADRMDDEFFGLDRHPLRRGTFAALSQIAVSGETLEQSLRRVIRALRALLDDLHGELVVEGDMAHVRLHSPIAHHRVFAYGTWYILVHGLACWVVRRRIPVLALSFEARSPFDDSDYRYRFCDEVQFDRDFTALTFASSYLALPVAQGRSDLKAFLSEAPLNLLVKYRNDQGFASTVRRRLRESDPSDWPELEYVAKSLRMSVPTLQRRLLAEGTSFQMVKDELRRDMAITLLAEGGQSIPDVGASVGFKETSAFFKAFKKWTGVSPGCYRKR